MGREELTPNQRLELARAVYAHTGHPPPRGESDLSGNLNQVEALIAQWLRRLAAVRETVERLSDLTEGVDRVGTARWNEPARDGYSLAVEECRVVLEVVLDEETPPEPQNRPLSDSGASERPPFPSGADECAHEWVDQARQLEDRDEWRQCVSCGAREKR